MPEQTRINAILFAFVLFGCDSQPVPKDVSSDDSAAPSCRSGLNTTSIDGFSFVELAVDGLSTLPQPESVCMSSDGLEFELVYAVEDITGRVGVGVSEAGAWGVPSAQVLGLRVIYGDAEWNAPTFYAGSVSVEVSGTSTEGSLEAEATNDTSQLNINLVWTAPLP